MKQCWYDNEANVEDRCPHCRESRMDYLVWDEDGVHIRCATCGTVYEITEGASK